MDARSRATNDATGFQLARRSAQILALAGCSEFSAPQPAVSGTDGGAARSAKRAARRNASATATKGRICLAAGWEDRTRGNVEIVDAMNAAVSIGQRCRSDYAPFWSSRSDELRRSLASLRARRRPARPNRKIAGDASLALAQGPIKRSTARVELNARLSRRSAGPRRDREARVAS